MGITMIPRRTMLIGSAAMCASVVSSALPNLLWAKVPAAAVTFKGPIPISADSIPWGTAIDGGPREALLKLHAYVEEEYFVSGEANIYGPGNKTPDKSKLSPLEYSAELRPLEKLVRPDVPFMTRAVMLRPKDMRTFSGNVHLIPLHNLDGTTYVERNLLRNGDVWIGLEVNGGTRFGVEERPSGGVVNLRRYNSQRYGQLDLPAGDPSDWPDLQPGRLGEAFKNINFGRRDAGHNVFRQEISRSYAQAPDIMTKTAEALRGNAPTSPLAGHKVRRIYTSGRSGQTTILGPYIDFHHQAAHRSLGHPPFDGYMIRVGVLPASRPQGAALIVVQSEAEIIDIKGTLLASLSDSDDPMFRYYEIPGVGHGLTARPNISGRIGEVVPKGVQGISDIEGESRYQPYDKVSLPLVWAMWRNMYDWLDKGIPMPRAPRVDRDPNVPDGLHRDRFGNATGGIRLPWLDFPDAHYVGVISEKNPLEGGMQPFSEAKMKELYGSEQAYLAKLDKQLEHLARDRWISAEDIPLMRKRGVSAALALGYGEYQKL